MSSPSNKLVVMDMAKGLENDRTAFNIANDAFPTLQNAYLWRGRCLRKRGTALLGQLEREVELEATPGAGVPAEIQDFPLINGINNLLQPYNIYMDVTYAVYSLGALSPLNNLAGAITGASKASQAVITVNNTFSVGQIVTISGVLGMTQLNGNSYLITAASSTHITIYVNSTGFTTYTSGGKATPNAFIPSIVPGTVSLSVGGNIYTDPAANGILVGAPSGTGTINYNSGALVITGGGTDTVTGTFNYYPSLPVMGLEDFDIGLINQPVLLALDTSFSYQFDQLTNTFYDTTFYKNTKIPFEWNGANYQQFNSTNYLGITTVDLSVSKTGCLWVTNGNPGFHFLNGTYVSGSGTMAITFTFSSQTVAFSTLVVGDVLWFNEWSTASALNGISGTVSSITDAATGTYVVTFAINITFSGGAGTGIAQMMTNFLPNQDGIRWYDGDPTTQTYFGWVNFAPPLSAYTSGAIGNIFYIVGADIIIPFKQTLMLAGVYIATATTAPIYYPNRTYWSQQGTPFYSNPLPYALSQTGQQPFVKAWYTQVGFGGFLPAPIDQEIITVAPNNDVLIFGFESQQLKFIYTFDSSFPFVFQTINSELGSQNTFSAVVLHAGVLSIGDYGILMTTENSCQRIDLQIPDAVFDVSVRNNNNYRVCAARDFRNEWVYFTYCPGTNEFGTGTQSTPFPSQTLLYNYRENSWAVFKENYTTYGSFRRTTSRSWAQLGEIYGTWSDWNDPWNFGGNQAFFPNVAGGNQNGFVMLKGIGTNEDPSQYIAAITNATMTINAPNHCLINNDFIEISGATGMAFLDLYGNPVLYNIFQISVIDNNNFTIFSPTLNSITGTYVGGGVYSVLAVPFIQTKQFPMFWQHGRQMRAGIQKFLFQTTVMDQTMNSSIPQITLDVYSSQNADTPDNDPSTNSYLVASNIILTTAEPNLYGSDNVYQLGQAQTWHRISNSFNGDSIQFGVTLSDDQMFDGSINSKEIVLHAIMVDLHPGPILA